MLFQNLEIWNNEEPGRLRYWLFGLDGVLFENFCDALVDWLGNYLRIRLQVSARRSLQHVRYRSTKDNPIAFAI